MKLAEQLESPQRTNGVVNKPHILDLAERAGQLLHKLFRNWIPLIESHQDVRASTEHLLSNKILTMDNLAPFTQALSPTLQIFVYSLGMFSRYYKMDHSADNLTGGQGYASANTWVDVVPACASHSRQ